jgi:hypothetical protein
MPVVASGETFLASPNGPKIVKLAPFKLTINLTPGFRDLICIFGGDSDQLLQSASVGPDFGHRQLQNVTRKKQHLRCFGFKPLHDCAEGVCIERLRAYLALLREFLGAEGSRKIVPLCEVASDRSPVASKLRNH